jgi:tRNA U34 2-thiouridine synthase MnmA/TrmU
MAKAIALYSGGLDSTLAILVMLRQGIEVTALTFLTHFGCDISDRSSCSKNPFKAADQFGFTIKLCHLADKFIEIVKNPKFGHGKNMNPCIDCRILMLCEAKEFMKLKGADFIITGEVLGQRPMSQRREILPLIDREAGLEGYVLRPLTALNLKPTIPEERGLVKRELLYGFKGRSRKPQMALAEEFGLRDYPSPAGGCLLTDPIYSYRLRELLSYNPDPSVKEINLLRLGRHFRLSPQCKAIVGRDEEENAAIESLAERGNYLLKVIGYGSPTTLLTGRITERDIELGASLCARYSDGKQMTELMVKINALFSNGDRYLSIRPATLKEVESLRIKIPESCKQNVAGNKRENRNILL